MNTINICLGHQLFPQKFSHCFDLFLAPMAIPNVKRLVIIPDEIYGSNGHSLSEYAQLIWLYRNLDTVASTYEYIRIFQYRRFISSISINGVQSSNTPWSTTISIDGLENALLNFERNSSAELFNANITINGGVVSQYAETHVLEDFLNFTNYLVEQDILSKLEACQFIRFNRFIPASSMGVFTKATFSLLYSYLERASGFMNSRHFIVRPGYQRRSMGFLLERLNSYLIFLMIDQKKVCQNFGQNIVISDSPFVSATIERVN